MKLTYGVMIGFVSIIACLSLALFSCKREIESLKETQTTLQSELAQCKAGLSLQNLLVTQKQNELESYDSKITQIQADFKQKSAELDKSISEVKNCEQALSYLRKMLISLKGI